MIRGRYISIAVITCSIIYIATTIGISNVFANGTTTPPVNWGDNIFETAYEFLGVALNIIYIITLPLLTIAGKAMDNSMVYGEFINLDRALYMLWNISRTFANFAIGWVFLYKIIKYIFIKTDSDIGDLKPMIIKSFGAILGINFSRFILWALLDLSTILIYSVWSMPLNLLWQLSVAENNMPILSINNFINYESNDTTRGTTGKIENHVYYQWNGINIAPCGIDGQLVNWFVVGPKYYPTIPDKTSVSFEPPNKCWNGTEKCKHYCSINTMELADITELEKWKETNLWGSNSILIDPNKNQNDNRMIREILINLRANKCSWWNLEFDLDNATHTFAKDKLEELIKVIPYVGSEELSFCGGTIKAKSNSIYDVSTNDRKTLFIKWDGTTNGYTNINGLSTKSLLDQSKGMVWPFVTLYMTLLDFSNISLNNSSETTLSWAVWWITEFLVRAIIGILLLVPLIALSVSLIMRIWLLRWIIAFSPLGIIAVTLFDMKSWDWILKDVNIWSILGLIFWPIVPVFALSISIIFIQALHGQMKGDIETQRETRWFLGINFTAQTSNNNTVCADFWWMQQICYKTDNDVPASSVFVNLFPRLFVNIFAIAIMRFLVKMSFAASPLTQWAANSVMNIWKSLASSIPIIPIPGLWKLSAWNIFWSDRNASIADRILDTWWEKVRSLDQEGQKNLDTLFKDFAEWDKKKEVWWDVQWSVPNKIDISKINTGKVKEWITEHINKNQKINLAQAEAIINNNAIDKNNKIITWSTTQDKVSQLVDTMNQIYKDDKDNLLKHNRIMVTEWITDIIKKSYDTWSIIIDKEDDKNKLIEFINDGHIKPFLTEEKNMLDTILKNITHKDPNGTIYKLINKEWWNIEWTTE